MNINLEGVEELQKTLSKMKEEKQVIVEMDNMFQSLEESIFVIENKNVLFENENFKELMTTANKGQELVDALNFKFLNLLGTNET